MSSVFTRIILREIPGYIVAEDDLCIAFLDVNPLKMGHTLVVPKVEIDRFFDLHPDLLSHVMKFAQNVAHALEKAVACKKVGVAVIGLEVPHAHVHLVPINQVADLDFSKPKLTLSPEELSDLCERIKQFI